MLYDKTISIERSFSNTPSWNLRYRPQTCDLTCSFMYAWHLIYHPKVRKIWWRLYFETGWGKHWWMKKNNEQMHNFYCSRLIFKVKKWRKLCSPRFVSASQIKEVRNMSKISVVRCEVKNLPAMSGRTYKTLLKLDLMKFHLNMCLDWSG